VDCKPIGFKEVVKDEKWRNAMDEKPTPLHTLFGDNGIYVVLFFLEQDWR
jgi:hypothetical protein